MIFPQLVISDAQDPTARVVCSRVVAEVSWLVQMRKPARSTSAR